MTIRQDGDRLCAISLDERVSEASLFKVHPVPTFLDNKQAWPVVEFQFMAVSRYQDVFTPLTADEAMACESDGICTSVLPSFKDVNKICGGQDFWPNLREKSCKYTLTEKKSPYFLTIGNRTFFSTPKKTIIVEVECSHEMYNAIGGDKFEELVNKGVLELPWTCEGHYGDLFFRPAERTLKDPEIQPKPIENVVNVVYLDDKNSVMKIRHNKFVLKDMSPVSINAMVDDVVDRTAALIYHENDRRIDIKTFRPRKNEPKSIDLDYCYEGGKTQYKFAKEIKYDQQSGEGLDIAECSGGTSVIVPTSRFPRRTTANANKPTK